MMRAIIADGFGDEEILRIGQVPRPQCSPEQVLVKVNAVGMNRADILQRRGLYAPPAGESPILGLEAAGEIVAVGESVAHLTVGQRVFGLVGGGAYSEYVAMDAQLAVPTPDSLSDVEAAAVIEAFVTAHETLVELGQVQAGERVLIRAAGSGIGTTTAQMAIYLGADVFATTGSADKVQKIRQLGVSAVIHDKTQDFAAEIMALTHDQGIDVIQDVIGARDVNLHLNLLRAGGRLVILALMGGHRTDISLVRLLTHHVQIKGFILRTRPLAEKRAMVQRFVTHWLPLLADKTLRPIIDTVFKIENVAAAHRYMAHNNNVGKIVLQLFS
jgi:NADPH:quinone reductase